MRSEGDSFVILHLIDVVCSIFLFKVYTGSSLLHVPLGIKGYDCFHHVQTFQKQKNITILKLRWITNWLKDLLTS